LKIGEYNSTQGQYFTATMFRNRRFVSGQQRSEPRMVKSWPIKIARASENSNDVQPGTANQSTKQLQTN